MTMMRDLTPEHAALAGEIATAGISAADVLRLRRELFGDGTLGRSEAALLFHLNERSPAGNAPEWYDFYVEALTAYFVWQQQPPRYLSADDAAFLVGMIRHDGRIDDAAEFALLMNVLHHLRVAPQDVVDCALDGLRQTVLQGGTVLFGPDRRRAGVIDEADLEVIRAVIFAPAADAGLTVSRQEADLLFDLHEATRGAKNAPGWTALFVEAIAHHLMFPGEPGQAPDRQEALRRERWLEERRGSGSFLARMLQGLTGSGEPTADAEEPLEISSFAREAVDAAEAAWLLSRIDADGAIDAVEQALLTHLARTAPRIDAALAPLLARAGLHRPA